MARDPLPEGELRAVSSGFELDAFLDRRRDLDDLHKVFRLLDGLYHEFSAYHFGHELTDEQTDWVVRSAVAAGLARNRVFRDFVLQRKRSSGLTQDEVWKAIYLAAAGELMLKYWAARDGGKWPL